MRFYRFSSIGVDFYCFRIIFSLNECCCLVSFSVFRLPFCDLSSKRFSLLGHLSCRKMNWCFFRCSKFGKLPYHDCSHQILERSFYSCSFDFCLHFEVWFSALILIIFHSLYSWTLRKSIWILLRIQFFKLFICIVNSIFLAVRCLSSTNHCFFVLFPIFP